MIFPESHCQECGIRIGEAGHDPDCPGEDSVQRLVRPQGFVVELEPGVWLAEMQGDPGRTCDRDSAKVFLSEEDAIRGKARARRMRPFPNAKIEAA